MQIWGKKLGRDRPGGDEVLIEIIRIVDSRGRGVIIAGRRGQGCKQRD